MKNFNILIVLSLLLPNLIQSQMDSLKIKSTSDFAITGKGDNSAWANTDWVNLPKRNSEGLNYQTHVKVLYSSKGIYFLFHCEDEIITSTITEDYGKLYEEDVVEVFLWTDENYPFYFEYELSPTNYELPIFVPNVNGTFMGWKPWQYENERRIIHQTYIEQKDGKVSNWSAEFFIPYALLKPMSNVPPKSGTIWRANMYRLDYDKGNTRWSWQPYNINFHDYKMYGKFIFE